MSINAGIYIPVTSTVQNVLSTAKVFAGLALSANPLIPTTNPLLKFTSAAAVETYFGSASTEYQAATKYFASYSSATQVPPYIYFGKYVYQAISPYVFSAAFSNPTTALANLITFTSGAPGDLTITVDGIPYATSAINLSAATSMSQVASTIQADIWAAHSILNGSGLDLTVTYSGTTNQFIVTQSGTGTSSTLSFFSSSGSPSLATALQLTSATGAVLSQGEATMTAAQNMLNLQTYFTDQFSIFFVDTLNGTMTGSGGDAINLAMSAWVSGQVASGNQYAFFLWSNESNLENSSDTSTIWYQVTQALYANVAIFDEVIYNTSDRAAAASGIFASVDLNQANSAITLAFKTQASLLPSVTSTAIATTLDTKEINYYGNIGVSGTTTQVNWFYGGYLTGPWAYIDNLVASVWTTVQIQIAIASFFGLVPQIPNDPYGDSQVRALITGVMDGNVTNGIIALGLTFDTATSQALIAQGVNPQELTNNGYVILKAASSQSQRQARQSAPWSVFYVKASAVQYLPINTITYF